MRDSVSSERKQYQAFSVESFRFWDKEDYKNEIFLV